MELKNIVDTILKDQNRSLSWLAVEMNKTFDGMKLSLVKESIKYTDLKRMAVVLKVPVAAFFNEKEELNLVAEEMPVYTSLKSELGSCRELVKTLKSQIVDKEKIIGLLSEPR
ncbi:MAG: hypothetical protein H7Y07_02620 [Pyrinomonadaceae bacterium]|nr:hypothetical protein [Sphingobacteriaceae bacterium]